MVTDSPAMARTQEKTLSSRKAYLQALITSKSGSCITQEKGLTISSSAMAPGLYIEKQTLEKIFSFSEDELASGISTNPVQKKGDPLKF